MVGYILKKKSEARWLLYFRFSLKKSPCINPKITNHRQHLKALDLSKWVTVGCMNFKHTFFAVLWKLVVTTRVGLPNYSTAIARTYLSRVGCRDGSSNLAPLAFLRLNLCLKIDSYHSTPSRNRHVSIDLNWEKSMLPNCWIHRGSKDIYIFVILSPILEKDNYWQKCCLLVRSFGRTDSTALVVHMRTS